MKTKILSFATLLILNFNLLSASRSNDQQDQVVASIKLKVDEESKINEEAQKVITETRDMVLKLLMDPNNCTAFLKEALNGLNRNQIKPAWDCLILEDHKGENINKLATLLKTKLIKIDEKISNSVETPIRFAIMLPNYKLFEFLLTHGAVLTVEDLKLIELWHKTTNDNEKIDALNKMKYLYYSIRL